jgi:RimJ/RimL family protein N-acetyltransferase
MAFALETRRLALREMTQHDLDFVATMLADAEVMRFYRKCYSREESAAWVDRQRERYARDGHGLWLVLDRETGEPVGQVGLVAQQVDDVTEPEVGYLIHRPHWRRGFAAEAATATRDYAFGSLDLPRVISLIRPENVPSQGVARRIGMRPERHTRYADFEHLVFAVTRTSAR